MKMSKEIKIALVAVVGILIMYFGINFLKGINLFSSHNYYYITFNDTISVLVLFILSYCLPLTTFRDWEPLLLSMPTVTRWEL